MKKVENTDLDILVCTCGDISKEDKKILNLTKSMTSHRPSLFSSSSANPCCKQTILFKILL